MSLINEALKKAQRQRSLDAAPLSAAPSGVAAAAVTTRVASASSGRRSLAPLWFGLGLVAIGAAATVFVMRYTLDDSTPAASANAPTTPAVPSAPAATAPAATSASAPALVEPVVRLPAIASVQSQASRPVAAPAPAPDPVTPATPTPAPLAPVAATVAPAATPVAAPSPVAQPAITSSAAPTASPVTVAPAAPVVPVATVAPVDAAQQEAKIYAFLGALRIGMVRGVDAQARVLMNEKVFRLNDIVEPSLGLRLSGVRPGLLAFTDAAGKRYEKPY